MKNPERFWMVHGSGPSSARHSSYESAANEARRLSRLCPGQTFVVLEAVKAFRKVDIEEMDIERGSPSKLNKIGDGIPF